MPAAADRTTNALNTLMDFGTAPPGAVFFHQAHKRFTEPILPHNPVVPLHRHRGRLHGSKRRQLDIGHLAKARQTLPDGNVAWAMVMSCDRWITWSVPHALGVTQNALSLYFVAISRCHQRKGPQRFLKLLLIAAHQYRAAGARLYILV